MIKQVLGLTTMAILLTSVAQADSASGMAAGKRQHQPITISKSVDKVGESKAIGALEQAAQQARQGSEAAEAKGDNRSTTAHDVLDEKHSTDAGERSRQSRADDDVSKKTDKSKHARAKKRG